MMGGMKGRPMPGTGGVNVGMRKPLPVLPAQASDRAREALAAAMYKRSPNAMGPGSSIMDGGRAFKSGGMVGCGWSPKSSATMRGAARKG